MEIWYLGFGSFRIRTKRGIIITDPYDEATLKPRTSLAEASLITVSRPNPLHGNQVVKGEPFVINAPGEYEIGGINVLGIPSCQEKENNNKKSDNVIYLFHIGEISIAHLGQLNHQLSKESLAQLDSPDIVFLPLGEENGLTVKYAAEIIRQIEAKIILPIHYIKESGHLPLDQVEPIVNFLKEAGESPKVESKLIISKNDLIGEEVKKFILLENRGKN